MVRPLLCLACLAVTGLVTTRPGLAQTSYSWLDPGWQLSDLEKVPSGQLPESVGLAGNIACATRTFVTRPARPPVQTEQSSQACAVGTALGWVAPSGFTDVFKSDAKLFNDGGGPANFRAVPGGHGGVSLESTAQGTSVHYYDQGVLSSKRIYNPVSRELQIFLSPNPTWTLRDGSGKVLHVRPESLAFSSNGKWMVADVAFLASIIVNLENGQVVPFANPYNYHLGFSVMPQLAVSDDGKTVITTAETGSARIVDIGSCGPAPKSIIGPVSCQTVVIDGFLRERISGYRRVYQPRFITDSLIRFYAGYNTADGSGLAAFRMAPRRGTVENRDYLALGDSFVSGEGAYDYFPETDTPENMCHLSRQAYPYLIGRQQMIRSYNSVACSGARIDDLMTTTQKLNKPPTSTLGEWLPGSRPQIQYARQYNPAIITVGVGGNDVGFITKLRACLSVGTCYPTYEDRIEIVHEMNRQLPRLKALYEQLKTAAKPGTRVYAIGYPRVIKPNGTCRFDAPLNSREAELTNQLIDYLNQVIKTAAAQSGVMYVDASGALDGHQLCEPAAPVAFNGIKLGDDSPFDFGPIGNESFHPNQLGHQLLRQTVLARTQNLSAPMPAADLNAALPPESDLSMLRTTRTGRVQRELRNDENLSGENFRPGQLINITAIRQFLKPDSLVRIEIHSAVTQLAEVNADKQGDIQATVRLPPDIKPGFHSLHLYGESLQDQAIDIYKGITISQPDEAKVSVGQQQSKEKTMHDPRLLQISLGLQIGVFAWARAIDFIQSRQNYGQPAALGALLPDFLFAALLSVNMIGLIIYIGGSYLNHQKPDKKVVILAIIAGLLLIFYVPITKWAIG